MHSFSVIMLLCAYFIHSITAVSPFNLTYGHLIDEMITFKSIDEYKLFIQSNNLNTNINEPAYLVKCIEANNNLLSACLDGTPQSFYFRAGYKDGINKFMIYIKGGGWCTGIDEAVTNGSCANTCYDRSRGSLGSSKSLQPYMYIPTSRGDDYIGNQYNDNPLAYNWNTIWINYCDGASFSGNNATNITTKTNNVTIYFRGWRNLNAVFELLWNQYGLDKATDVILTGSSAGGLAVYLHADYIGNNFVPKGANYMALPDSGFFIDYYGNGDYDGCMKWIYEWQNTSIALNKQCMMNVNNDYKCMFAQYTAPYIESKILALQSRFDKYQINSELMSNNSELINEYGNNLTNILMDTFINNGKYKNNHAVFLESCFHHTGKWNSIIIDGYNSSKVEVDFWFGNGTHSNVWFQNQTYPCNTCCTHN